MLTIPIILASASPRRLELLRLAGLQPVVVPADVDETMAPGEAPRDAALRLARAKAARVSAGPAGARGPSTPAGALVIGADTVVDVDGRALLKPADRGEARRMIALLAGRSHAVHTGVALRAPAGAEAAVVVTSEVRFAPLSAEEADWYADSGEGLDKAGGYAIQGLASLFVESVNGSYSNVVGLPVAAVYRLARELGFDLRR